MDFDLATVMTGLSRRRPIFHSERDFQFALAWEVQLQYPRAQIRLEPRPRRGVHLDMLVGLDGRRVAVELKYLVQAFAGIVDGEEFDLPNQGAQDLSRYDVIKDVVRVERLLHDGYAEAGNVVALTNDAGYWRPATRTDTIGSQFRIHEGRMLEGTLQWDARAGAGTVAARETPLALSGRYECRWREYATVAAASGRLAAWRYLMLPVTAAARPRLPSTDVPRPRPAATVPQQAPSAPPRRLASTARQQILDAARDLAARSDDGTFTPEQIIAVLRRAGSHYPESTIRTHIVSLMCANAPKNHKVKYDDFERVDRGTYHLKRP